MKVTYFYRPKIISAFSIETVFSTISNALKGQIDIKEYYCSQKLKRFASLFEAWKYQGDINHITGDIYLLAFGLKKGKTIITVHDIGYYENNLKGIKKYIFGLLWYKLPMKRVSAITTISTFTKNKLINHFNIPSNKINVIFNPAPSDFQIFQKQFMEVSS